MPRLTVFALSILLGTGAAAQSSVVGLEGGRLEFESTGAAELGAAFLITGQHGLQLDIAMDRSGDSWRAQAGGHLYLIPGRDRRYGVFGRFSDLNDAPVWAIEAGIEGVWALGDSIAGLQAGAGLARPGALDYLFAGASWQRPLDDTFSVAANAAVQEFDEAHISAIGTQVEIRLDYHPRKAPLTLSIGYKADALSGYASDAALFLAASYIYGATPTFAFPDPLAGLWSRGLVGN